jgi:hypothetical protein
MSEIVGEFVWIEGPNGKGPVAEKWPLHPIEATIRDKVVLARYPLNLEQFSMKLAILEQRFPAPATQSS